MYLSTDVSHIVLKSEGLKERGLVFWCYYPPMAGGQNVSLKGKDGAGEIAAGEWGRKVGNQKKKSTLLPCKFG